MSLETKPTPWGDVEIVCDASVALCSAPTLAGLGDMIDEIRILKDVQKHGTVSRFSRNMAQQNALNSVVTVGSSEDDRGIREAHLALENPYWDMRISL